MAYMALVLQTGVWCQSALMTFKFQTATRKTLNNTIHWDIESFSSFLTNQYFSGSASPIDVFSVLYASLIGKDYRVVRTRQHSNVNDRHIGLLQSDGHFSNLNPWSHSMRSSHTSCQFEFSVRLISKWPFDPSALLAYAVSVLGRSSLPFQHL